MTEFRTVTNIETGETTDSYIVNAKEIEIIKREVTKQDICLDIGANVGFLTTILAEQAAMVMAFEPSPDNFDKLLHNIPVGNIVAYNYAITDKDNEESILYYCPQDPGMHRLYRSKWCEGGGYTRVKTRTIDSIMSEYQNRKVNFIKIDVEGYEYYAIQGMRKLLQRDHPTILMEWHPPSMEEAGTNPEELYHILKYELEYYDITNCNTDEFITLYNQLDKQTRYTPAVNILWKYNNNS